ncbi:MAG: DUF4159 domain-containing protein, partial [Planctomycetota bacterium]|nr:DUF4159 domain-containing protein [Planctomycetota bacterium]
MKHAIVLLAAVMLLCGTALAVNCPVCGAKNLDGAAVCEECKAALPVRVEKKPPVAKPPVVKPPAVKPGPAPVGAKPASQPDTPEAQPFPRSVAGSQPALPPMPGAPGGPDGSEELPPELRPGYTPPVRSGSQSPLLTSGSEAAEDEERAPDAMTFDPKTYPSQRGSITFGDVDDAMVGKAIKAGAASLWAQQRANGAWPAYGDDPKFFNYQGTGLTAMAVYTLIESGVKVEDARIKKALAWLSSQEEAHTYSLGLRACAYATAARKAPGDDRGKLLKLLKADVDQLIATTVAGAYGYYASPKILPGRWDNSNSQYGVLGVWAAAQLGMEIPDKYWQAVAGHWSRVQLPDGGWSYAAGDKTARGTMTVAGVASMMVCYEQLLAGQFLNCGVRAGEAARIEAGLNWLIKNFGVPGSEWYYYYWYGVERVGLASGMKYFGKVDWYKEGVNRMGGAGAQATIQDTCFVMLFLIRGRRPVIINHLQYNGDWNNRPQALAVLTRWLGDNFEHTVSWQNINIQAPVTDWHDAPILFVSGSRKPTFAPAELDKLREYVHQGGVIFSLAECDGKEFDTGMREAYKKIFPDYELARAGANHEIYSVRGGFDVSAEAPIFVMSNGVRPLVIHTDQDWAKAWQARQMQTERVAFALGGSVVHYVMLDTKTMANPRGRSSWPAAVATEDEAGAKIVRLRHGGNFDPEPLALQRFALLARLKDGIGVQPVGPIPVSELPAAKAKLATIVSTGNINMSNQDVATLKAFVTGGGTLLLEAAGGSAGFRKPAMDLIEKMFPGLKPQLLPPNHRLYGSGVLIKSVTYRPKTIRR